MADSDALEWGEVLWVVDEATGSGDDKAVIDGDGQEDRI